MSTIAFGSAAVIPARAATRLRLTSRGRRVLLAVAAVPLAAAIGFGVISGGTAIASNDSAATTAYDTVTVVPGDSLWSIASKIAPHADPREVINELIAFNALEGASIQAGDELAIPEQYTK
ncbi:MAG: LysM peptidoglycan-binding domain-containing protein [Microbacterium sp.]